MTGNRNLSSISEVRITDLIDTPIQLQEKTTHTVNLRPQAHEKSRSATIFRHHRRINNVLNRNTLLMVWHVSAPEKQLNKI